jgi:hypothetical protein
LYIIVLDIKFCDRKPTPTHTIPTHNLIRLDPLFKMKAESLNSLSRQYSFEFEE